MSEVNDFIDKNDLKDSYSKFCKMAYDTFSNIKSMKTELTKDKEKPGEQWLELVINTSSSVEETVGHHHIFTSRIFNAISTEDLYKMHTFPNFIESEDSDEHNDTS